VVIRKKEIKPVCEFLSVLIGPFGFYGLNGDTLYVTEGFGDSDEKPLKYAVPLNSKPIGYVYGSDDRLETAASILGLFLKNRQDKESLTKHTLNKYRELNFLSEISDILSSSIDIDEILCATTAKCGEIMGVENCSVMVIDDKSNGFYLKAASGRTVNDRVRLDLSSGIAGRVVKTERPLIVNETERHPDFISGGDVGIKSMLCIPLKVKDRTVGVLNMSNKISGFFTSEDESLIISISSMIAGAIESARLYDEKIKNEKFATIGQMAAGIIHDIKNPMATIKGFAGLLGDLEFTPEERKEYSGMIVDEVDRLVSMLEDLLYFSRGFKGRYNIQRTNIHEYLSGVYELIGKDLSSRNIDVSLITAYSGDVYIDREKFRRVIYNITGNAREVMHEGGRLLISTRAAGDQVEILFSDTGGVVPKEIIDTIFDPFVTMGKKSGTGLGLAITKKIVEDHGGMITAINGNHSGVEGFNGAKFVIKIPEKDHPGSTRRNDGSVV